MRVFIKKESVMKTIISLLLAVVCIFSFSISTFAADAVDLTGKQGIVTAGNYEVNESTTTETSPNKGRDGAACSDKKECESDVCEGGSCCTDYGKSCDSNSHCCGHQSCTDNFCPQ